MACIYHYRDSPALLRSCPIRHALSRCAPGKRLRLSRSPGYLTKEISAERNEICQPDCQKRPRPNLSESPIPPPQNSPRTRPGRAHHTDLCRRPDIAPDRQAVSTSWRSWWWARSLKTRMNRFRAFWPDRQVSARIVISPPPRRCWLDFRGLPFLRLIASSHKNLITSQRH